MSWYKIIKAKAVQQGTPEQEFLMGIIINAQGGIINENIREQLETKFPDLKLDPSKYAVACQFVRNEYPNRIGSDLTPEQEKLLNLLQGSSDVPQIQPMQQEQNTPAMAPMEATGAPM